jgi:calcineurin-like phosphoesterase family protein
MIHFIADTHFNHANIIHYSQRPFSSVEEMNESLICKWNEAVQPQDTVYHLGDFGFGNIVPILQRLHGTKILLLGDHDNSATKPAARVLFQRQERLAIVKAEGHHIVLCHWCMRVWPQCHYGAWHLFGHSHGALPAIGLSMDVGVDATKLWRPVSLPEVAAYMAEHKLQVEDNHQAHEQEEDQ